MTTSPFVLCRNLQTGGGINGLRRLFQAEMNTLRQAPVLLISSSPPSDGKANNKQSNQSIKDACHLVEFTLSKQFGLRTIETQISSAFPTIQDMNQRMELMQRTGAASIVAVGSGVAMDLAKAMQINMIQSHIQRNTQSTQKPLVRTIIIPSTYCGILAAGTSHSLLLDSIEETLVPHPKQQHFHDLTISNFINDDSTGADTTIVAPLDVRKYMESLDDEEDDEEDDDNHADSKVNTILYACIAIILDATYRKVQHPLLPELTENLTKLLKLEEQVDDERTKANELSKLLFQSSSLVSYGLDLKEDRSILLALTSSLIPRLFPHIHPLTFFACLVPGFYHLLQEREGIQDDKAEKNRLNFSHLMQTLHEYNQNHGANSDYNTGISPTMNLHNIPSLTLNDETLEGFSIPDMALSHIKSNQTVWKCLDVPDDVLMQILQCSMKQ